MNEYGTTKETIDYKILLKYIESLKKSNIKIRSLQGYIGSLKVYFDYLQEENYRADNPIANTNIKGTPKTVLGNLLTQDELEDLYYSYETNPISFPLRGNAQRAMGTRKRNKVIIGLLVYQGLQTKEIPHLKEEHLELYKGKITIPSTSKTNSRILEIKPWQLIDMIEYMKEIRPQLVPKEEDNLFTTNYQNSNLNNVIRNINKELKQYNREYQNAIQIRNSAIVNWLKQYNLRKVQYLAGHKYISSTERYKQDDLESLHEMINSFHPIR
jgi:site-specific recombinase XerD